MRATFKRMPDMDPSRYRPASEALIRRCLKSDFVRVNPIVDLNNVLSMDLRIPLGVYDGEQFHPPFLYRIGNMGEVYMTLSQATKNAEGKLVLADSAGVVGSPVTDSGRAVVRHDTTWAIVVAYLPYDASTEEGGEVCSAIETAFADAFGPETIQRMIVPQVMAKPPLATVP